MPRNNQLPNYESLLEFQEVYLRAVALAWTDAKFKAQLLDDPYRAFRDTFSYILPWNVELRIFEPIDPKQGWNPKARQWNLPLMRTTFGLPAAPAFEEQLVAFAAYNDAGPAYLFTCC
jgi:ribosomally synthesized peptide (two-chain TOMM family)